MEEKKKDTGGRSKAGAYMRAFEQANVTGIEDIQTLFKETIAEFLEDNLDAEFEETLSYGEYDHTARTESGTTNNRNGHSRKTLYMPTCVCQVENA